jgi:glycosyltransferase involved in cell wall biosynthesis
VAVARALSALGGDAQFLLIGPATADLAALGPLPGNLRHAGYAPDPLTAMAGLDVLLSLSHFAESFGRTVLEAMTAGRPVICYDRGTPPVLTGPAGTVVPPDDPQAVAGALLALLRDRARLQAASAAARARARALEQAADLPDSLLFAAVAARGAPRA